MDKFDIAFIQTAHIFSNLSHCTRLKVGAVLAKDRRITACGYNGTLPGTPNDCEDDGVTSPFVLHAEQNLLTFCNREGIQTDGCTLYITHSPCKDCAKLIASAGIKRVVFCNVFRDRSGIDFLREYGIPTQSYIKDKK
jgi:dCMP deaminase